MYRLMLRRCMVCCFYSLSLYPQLRKLEYGTCMVAYISILPNLLHIPYQLIIFRKCDVLRSYLNLCGLFIPNPFGVKDSIIVTFVLPDLHSVRYYYMYSGYTYMHSITAQTISLFKSITAPNRPYFLSRLITLFWLNKQH